MFLWLLLCPYKGDVFENYNKSRKLFMVALIILCMQYIVNMTFKFRATNIVYGITSNLFFYIPASYTFMLGMLNLQRAGHLKTTKVWHGIATTSLSYILLTIGIYYEDGDYQTFFNIICSALMFINQTYFSVVLWHDYKHTKKNIDEYYGYPAEYHTTWMRYSNILAIIAFLMLPIAIFSDLVIVIFGAIFWVAMAYYIANFMYYGAYVRIVDDSFEVEHEAEATEGPKEEAVTIVDKVEESDFEQILKQRIEDWISTEGYCDNEINIMKLAQQMETNRTTLSHYINSEIGMNFREWLNSLRIDKAKKEITKNPQLPLEGISAICGFSTRKYFDQVFASREGISAAEWRKKNT